MFRCRVVNLLCAVVLPRPGCILPKHARVTQRIPSRLWVDAQPVRTVAYGDAREEMSIRCIDGVDFGVVASGKPEHFAVRRDAAHIRTSPTGQLPFLHD